MRKLLLCAAISALVAPAALAGPPPPAPIDIDFKKAPGSQWIEYSAVRKNVGRSTKSVFWRVTNQDTDSRRTKLSEILGGPGVGDYRIRWFHGRSDITKIVRDSSFNFRLGSGSKLKFKVTMEAKTSQPDPICVTPSFDVTRDPGPPYTYGLYVNDDGVCG